VSTLTEEEWRAQYKEHLIEAGGIDVDTAQHFADQVTLGPNGDYLLDDDPDEAADSEMESWE
jgi:hypothetical protein